MRLSEFGARDPSQEIGPYEVPSTGRKWLAGDTTDTAEVQCGCLPGHLMPHMRECWSHVGWDLSDSTMSQECTDGTLRLFMIAVKAQG